MRRTKTYSALSGYVFQYVYAGHRLCQRPSAREYVFQVGSQRQASAEMMISIADAIPDLLAQHASREISPRECYALAKLKLFRVLDEWEPAAGSGHVPSTVAQLTPEEALDLWETLDL